MSYYYAGFWHSTGEESFDTAKPLEADLVVGSVGQLPPVGSGEVQRGQVHPCGHRTHAEQGNAIAAYIRCATPRATPKHDFAPGSVVRTWTSYQDKTA